MPYLRNPSGRLVDVTPERVGALIKQGFERVVYEPPPADAPEVSEPETDSYTIEEGKSGWFSIMLNGEKVDSARGREAAEEKLAALVADEE